MAGARDWDEKRFNTALNAGSVTYLGRIVSTTVKSNLDTGTPFTIPYGALLLVQPSAAVDVLPGATPTCTAANGVALGILEKYKVCLKSTDNVFQVVGAADTDVWLLE